MKNFLVLLAFSLLSLSVASASPLPCTISTGGDSPVTSGTVIMCGGLTFDNFQVLHPTGGAAGTVDILSAGLDAAGEIDLTFNPNLGPSQDEQLLFAVWGGITQIDMSAWRTILPCHFCCCSSWATPTWGPCRCSKFRCGASRTPCPRFCARAPWNMLR